MAENENENGNGVLTVYGAGTVADVETAITVKSGRTKMFHGGVIVVVVTPEQALIAEAAGACAVMVSENLAADIRTKNIVSRMSDPQIIKDIKNAVTIPVFATTRIGHYAEAQILQQIGVDFIDESEVLTPADHQFHLNKHSFQTPFLGGCKNLGEACRRILEGAVMIRTEGEAGNGNVMAAVRQIRSIAADVRRLINMNTDEVLSFSNTILAPYELVMKIKLLGRLPVPLFGAGGIATPADAALMMQLGCDAVIVGSGIFKSEDPVKTARAIVRAARHYNDPSVLAKVSSGLGKAMEGVISENPNVHRYD